jgi:predicted lipid-binding transport protein (Tim44 family)
MVLICDVAFARAGGGGGYSRGGGGSSSGGGGGNILAPLVRVILRVTVELLMYLCREYPIIGYPLTGLFIIFIIWLFILGIKSEFQERDNLSNSDTFDDASFSSYGDGMQDMYSNSQKEEESALDAIKSKDPDFSEKGFCARAKKAFLLIQKAWSDRDISKAEAFIADGTYEQFLIQLDFMKQEHILDVMENLAIKDSYILGFESDGNIDSIFLAITASGKNYKINDQTRKFIEGNKKEEDFTEIWTFIRRTGAKTLGKPGLIEGYCPNCGTKIQIGRHTNCSSCGCLLRSGQHDWILSNITQACEWVRRNNNLIPGVKKYIAFDNGFNVQHIEDRASMMFWRKISADRQGNIAPLRKIAVDKYYTKIEKEYSAPKGYDYFDNCAIGSIRVLAVDADKNANEDYCYVEFLWNGLPKSSNDKNPTFISKIKNLFVKKKNSNSVFVLKRKRGVMTDTKTGLCAAPCPNCGAMESNSSNNECEYCGAVMNDGNRDWVLEDILDGSDMRVDVWVSKVKTSLNKPIKFNGYTKPEYKTNKKPVVAVETAPSNTNNTSVEGPKPQTIPNNNTATSPMNVMNTAAGVIAGAAMAQQQAVIRNMVKPQNTSAIDQIKWLTGMMLIDGKIDREEFNVVCEYGLKLGIRNEIIANTIKSMTSQPNVIDNLVNTVSLPNNPELVTMIVRVAFANGNLTKEKLGMIKYVAKRMNFTNDQLKNVLESEKARFHSRHNT